MDGFFIEININNRNNNRLRKVKRLSQVGVQSGWNYLFGNAEHLNVKS